MVDEYQDTNRPQYLLIKRLAEVHRNLAVVGDPDQSIYKWRGADLRNILDFEHDFAEAHDRPARAELPLDPDHPRRGVGGDQPEPQPQGQAALDRSQGRRAHPSTTAATTSSRRPTSSSARSSRRAAEDVDAMVAVLYRTNAQSRAIEDALMREGVPYKIIGGVRFYERKEIKDALAYMKLVMNPHDDVSLRRVINVPARGIGKGVMDSLQAIDPDAVFADAPPLLAAGLQEISSARSLWAKLVYVVDEGKVTPRAVDRAALVPRHAGRRLAQRRAQDSVSITIGKMLDRTGYLKDLRDENTRRGRRAHREPDGAGLGRARVRDAAKPKRRSAGSSIACRCSRRPTRIGHARSARLADDDARGEGAGVPDGDHRRARGRPVPALALGRERRRARGGAAALLRRHDPRRSRSLVLTSAARRRVFGEYQSTEPSRFLDEIPAELVERIEPAYASSYQGSFAHSHYEFRTNPYGGQGPRPRAGSRARPTPTRSENQAAADVRLGMRVRHAQFGVGNVIAVEEHNDDRRGVVHRAANFLLGHLRRHRDPDAEVVLGEPRSWSWPGANAQPRPGVIKGGAEQSHERATVTGLYKSSGRPACKPRRQPQCRAGRQAAADHRRSQWRRQDHLFNLITGELTPSLRQSSHRPGHHRSTELLLCPHLGTCAWTYQIITLFARRSFTT